METLRRPKVMKLVGKNEKKGKELVESGKLGIVLLAGGQGARLEHEGPKGTYFVEELRESIFGIQLKKIQDTKKIHLFVMCSTDNIEQTKSFFEKNDYFGMKERIHFFVQNNFNLLDLDGTELKIGGKNVPASAGHGDVIRSLSKVIGLIDDLKISHLLISNIDNINAKLLDHDFIGESCDTDLTLKVVEKVEPNENVGVFCKDEEGRLAVLEYSEIPENLRNLRDNEGLYFRLANIMVQILSVSVIKKLMEKDIPIHYAYKKKIIKGKMYEFLKKEIFIFDFFKYIEDYKIFMVDKNSNFAPIKDKESVASAVEKYKKYHNI